MLTEPRWLAAEPRLQAALDVAGNTHGLVDVLRGIADGTYQWWQGERSDIVTELLTYPAFRACSIWLVGGDLGECLSIEPHIADWAKEQGCGRIQACGRLGWVRTLPGYRSPAACVVRDL